MGNALYIIYMWAQKISSTDASDESDVARKTVIDYYSFCREICDIVINVDSQPIGGPGHIVEICETHVRTRKYNRGRTSRSQHEQIWVFGGIDRDTKEAFAVDVPKRDKATLMPLIHIFIRPGTKIMSDHSISSDGGYQHNTVNHSVNFVSPDDPSIHTLTVERMWRSLKKTVKVNGRPTKDDGDYVFEFLYRHKHRQLSCPQFFAVFLSDLRRIYPGYGIAKLCIEE